MVWGLYEGSGGPLPPRRFRNGKTQEDAVDEVIEAFDDHRIVFLKGGVGSGKSIIGATVAGALGSGAINVPVKALQEQYESDYGGRLLIDLGRGPLKFGVLKGRDNFDCRFASRELGFERRCSSRDLPCTTPLGGGTPRWKIARKCEYWSPVYSSPVRALQKEGGCTVFTYDTPEGRQHFHRRVGGCPYYDQNRHYLEADILLYNNSKWHADTNMGKKPLAGVEVFDEGDLFLDGLNLHTPITRRMISTFLREAESAQAELQGSGRSGEGREVAEQAERVEELFRRFTGTGRPSGPRSFEGGAEELTSELHQLLKALDTDFARDLASRLELLLKYREVASFQVERGKADFFVAEPSVMLEDMLERSSGRILFMSATFHRESVLREVFGIEDYAMVEGETTIPGRVYRRRAGGERWVNWKKWQGREFREGYWSTLKDILGRAERPTLVQVHSYQYLPEGDGYGGIPSRGELRESDQEESYQYFRGGGREVLFSTKTDRGVDLPGDSCRSIVMLKHPFPSLKDPVLMAMRRKLGEKAFWSYYSDLARREMLQQVGRGLRSAGDWVEVWSPDLKLHRELEKNLPSSE